MESAEYPLTCTTNLLDILDEASLRNFTFKLRFDLLTLKQANIAMDYFFGIKDSNLQLKGLTSGDFATSGTRAANFSNFEAFATLNDDKVICTSYVSTDKAGLVSEYPV